MYTHTHTLCTDVNKVLAAVERYVAEINNNPNECLECWGTLPLCVSVCVCVRVCVCVYVCVYVFDW
jgi:hypothetical protein